MVTQFLISQSFPDFVGDDGVNHYPVGKNEIKWQEAAFDQEGIIHLDAQLKPKENCHAFAATELVCERELETNLLIDSNDGCIVWPNRKLIHNRPGKRFYRYNQDRIPVQLK